ncbi:MAG: tetratricopeptide repeat protein, partial [Desulfobacterales bacterium]
DAYFNRGVIYASGKRDYDLAISDISKAIERNPRLFKAYYSRGLIYDAKGNYQRAVIDYNRAIEINPKFANAYAKRGVFYGRIGLTRKFCLDLKKACDLGSCKYYDIAKNTGACQ